MTGIVKWFDPQRGYGFIICSADPASPEKPPAEIYVHYTGILGEGFRILSRGDTVQFEIGVKERGARAEKVVNLSKQEKNPAVQPTGESQPEIPAAPKPAS
jgi:CspA family cold shock protein